MRCQHTVVIVVKHNRGEDELTENGEISDLLVVLEDIANLQVWELSTNDVCHIERVVLIKRARVNQWSSLEAGRLVRRGQELLHAIGDLRHGRRWFGVNC